MARYAYDLHMHSCLSPCGDDDMTPHNIAAMAMINGLDIIALSDHNTARNIPAVMEAAREFGVTVVPGVEAETAEEIHLLCLFPEAEPALKMGAILEAHLPPVKNRPEIFGEQRIMDSRDNQTGTFDKLLINATDIPIEEMKRLAEELGGVCIAAHIDRTSNSIISNLGFIPEELGFTTLELSKRATPDMASDARYRYIHNSDAHYLTDISDPVWRLELEEKSPRAVVELLKRGNGFVGETPNEIPSL